MPAEEVPESGVKTYTVRDFAKGGFHAESNSSDFDEDLIVRSFEVTAKKASALSGRESSIPVSMTLNIDYQQLGADDKVELKDKIRDVLAANASVDQAAVSVTLTPGSVKVDARIQTSDAKSAKFIEQSMNTDNIAKNVVEAANSIPGVKAAAMGELKVTGLEVKTETSPKDITKRGHWWETAWKRKPEGGNEFKQVLQVLQALQEAHFAHAEYFNEWEAMYFQKLQEQGKLPTSIPVGKKQESEAQKFSRMASLLVHEVYKLDEATWCSISGFDVGSIDSCQNAPIFLPQPPNFEHQVAPILLAPTCPKESRGEQLLMLFEPEFQLQEQPQGEVLELDKDANVASVSQGKEDGSFFRQGVDIPVEEEEFYKNISYITTMHDEDTLIDSSMVCAGCDLNSLRSGDKSVQRTRQEKIPSRLQGAEDRQWNLQQWQAHTNWSLELSQAHQKSARRHACDLDHFVHVPALSARKKAVEKVDKKGESSLPKSWIEL